MLIAYITEWPMNEPSRQCLLPAQQVRVWALRPVTEGDESDDRIIMYGPTCNFPVRSAVTF